METRRIIYTRPEDGGVSIIIPTGTLEECMKDIPEGVSYNIVELNELPTHRTFRNAWVKEGKHVMTDLVKAKEHTHTRRREVRNREFAPHDEVIMKQIPGKDLTKAENERAKIRTKYDVLQTQIDAVTTERALLDIYEGLV